MNVIEISDLSYSYSQKERLILENINLNVKQGQVVGIIGLSGNGKSTLCYALTGIIPHVYSGNMSGTVKIFGEDVSDMSIPDIAKKVGIVFQDPDTQLFSPMVEDDIAFGPENLCIDREEIGKRIKDSLGFVGMSESRFKNTNELSGGQKQLISIASVLSMKPDIFVFDEIFAQVDKDAKKKLKKVVLDLKNKNKTVIMVEHDLKNLDICDRVVLLKDRKLHECFGKEYIDLIRLIK